MKYFQGMLTGFFLLLFFLLITASDNHKPNKKPIKASQYKVVSAMLKDKLEDKIEQHLKDGWRLRGDILGSDVGTLGLIQVMVK